MRTSKFCCGTMFVFVMNKSEQCRSGYFTAPPPPRGGIAPPPLEKFMPPLGKAKGGGGGLAPPWDRNPWKSVAVRP